MGRFTILVRGIIIARKDRWACVGVRIWSGVCTGVMAWVMGIGMCRARGVEYMYGLLGLEYMFGILV